MKQSRRKARMPPTGRAQDGHCQDCLGKESAHCLNFNSTTYHPSADQHFRWRAETVRLHPLFAAGLGIKRLLAQDTIPGFLSAEVRATTAPIPGPL